MPTWWIYPVALSFLLSLVLSDWGRSWGRSLGFLDQPNGERKKHKGGTSTLGGVTIFVSFIIGVLGVLLFTDHFTSGQMQNIHFIGFLLGGLILVVGGLIDDKFELRPRYSILFPIVAALVAAGFGIGVSKITNPAGGYFEVAETLSFIVTFLWLMGMMYTTKLLDGLDGLSTGVSAIGMLMIAFLALTTAFYQPDVALLALIGFGSLLGFLVWNSSPASIFLGEGGSTLVGYLLGVMAVISGSKIATALLVVAIPVFDILFVMFNRYRSGKKITTGDRTHLHHKLQDIGLSPRRVVFFYYGIAVLFGLSTLVFESWQKLAALGVLFVVQLIIVQFVLRSRSV